MQDASVPVTVPGVLAPRRGHRFWAVPVAVAGLVLVGAVLVAAVVPSKLVARKCSVRDDADACVDHVAAPYAVVPGMAEAVSSRLSFDEVPRFDDAGQLLFVTVREPELTMLEWFVSRDEKGITPLSEAEKNPPDRTPEEDEQINLRAMVTAKQVAEYVALTKLGYPTEVVQGPVVVERLLCQAQLDAAGDCPAPVPAAAVLERGDVILAVDGEATPTGDALRAALGRRRIGDRVTVAASRDGDTVSGEIELVSSQEDTPRPILGFRPLDTSTVRTPFEIGISTDDIGGPSAGLAFTLAILDEMTPGSLTGGARVAVTGAIGIDGRVGAIGGLTSKTEAVKQTGASVFLVPTAQGESELRAAREIAGDDLRIVAVANLDEALAALASLGGNALELGQPGATYVSTR